VVLGDESIVGGVLPKRKWIGVLRFCHRSLRSFAPPPHSWNPIRDCAHTW
jgi:hypothetical protein